MREEPPFAFKQMDWPVAILTRQLKHLGSPE